MPVYRSATAGILRGTRLFSGSKPSRGLHGHQHLPRRPAVEYDDTGYGRRFIFKVCKKKLLLTKTTLTTGEISNSLSMLYHRLLLLTKICNLKIYIYIFFLVPFHFCISVALTTISVALALGIMPFNLWIYSRYWARLAVAVPYENLLITLVATVAPGVIGYLITWRKPKAGKVLAKVGGKFAFFKEYYMHSASEYISLNHHS